MPDDRQPPLNAEFEQEQAATRAYMKLVEQRLTDLVERHLTDDLGAVLESGGANRALKRAVADLLKSGELDETVRRELRAVLARNDRRSTPTRRWSWPSLVLGSGATVLLVLGVPWVAGVFSDPRTSPPSGDQAGPVVEANSGPVQPPGEETSGPLTAADYISMFDERFRVDRNWSRPLWTELNDLATSGVQLNLARWRDGDDFDEVVVRRAMVLLILGNLGRRVFLDGLYTAGCVPNNCVTVREEWIQLSESGGEPRPPILPQGDTWKSDTEALERFEKFFLALHLERLGRDG